MTEETLMDRCMRLEAENRQLLADTNEVNAARIYLREKEGLLRQLAATQADNERIRSVSQPFAELSESYEAQFGEEDAGMLATAVGLIDPAALRSLSKALSRPINLDALNEDRARVVEALRNRIGAEEGTVNIGSVRVWLSEEAEKHRAKKEG